VREHIDETEPLVGFGEFLHHFIGGLHFLHLFQREGLGAIEMKSICVFGNATRTFWTNALNPQTHLRLLARVNSLPPA